MSKLTAPVVAVSALAVVLTGCTAPDLDEAACQDVAAYVRGEMSRPRMLDRTNMSGLDVDLAMKLSDLREARDSHPQVWDLRLNTVAVRCLTLKDERGW